MIDNTTLQDGKNSIRVDVIKNTIDGDGVFGFSVEQVLSHPFVLETIGGSSIWHSTVLGTTDPLFIVEHSSPTPDWVLESIDCDRQESSFIAQSVGFEASLPGTTTTCTFVNRNAGSPPVGHQPLPDNHTLAEAAIEVPLNAFDTGSSPADTPHDVFIAVNDGFVILDPASGEVATAGNTRFSFTDFFFAPYFGGAVLKNDEAAGADAILTYRPTLGTYRRFVPETGRMSFTVTTSSTSTDMIHVGDDPDASEAVETLTSLNSIRYWSPLPGTSDWTTTPLLGPFQINTGTGRAVTAFMSRSPSTDTTARVILVKDGQPGTLAIGNPQSPSSAVVIIGNVGNDPKRVRCLDGVCGISNFGSGTLTIAAWDGGDVAAITATVPVGDGPIGIDVRRVGDLIEIISTGFNDNTVTITSVALDGTVIDSITSPVETGCVGPGHALWLSETDNAMYTCNTSGSYVVTSP